ncbi:MAG: DEAD/DEAH box helicase, partial [Anaerolineales bacterium]|nr:DEAD/DEAH box helicase [Anaerolineales bacterium]
QEQLLNSSNTFKVIGVGKVLDNLLQDIKAARESLFVVGPWIDGYFIRSLVGELDENVSVKFLIRPTERDAIVLAKSRFRGLLEARSLPTLHAKVIIIDNDIVYLGSTNWFKISLQQSREVTLRGHLSNLFDLSGILAEYWNEAKPIYLEGVKAAQPEDSIDYDILDPRLTQVGPIFDRLRRENPVGLNPKEYDHLWQELQKRKYRDFLSYEQGLITLKFLKGENVFGVLPTGGGKSLTFQLVSEMSEGLTLVISPLIALMKDYKEGEYFNSDLEEDQRIRIKNYIQEGSIRLLYISPERLKSFDFKNLLDSGRQQVKRVVIDEAHCVIEWGYSFRTKYLHIAQEIEAFERRVGHKIPTLLLTATASPWLQRQIIQNLRVEVPKDNVIIQEEGKERRELKIELQEGQSDDAKIKWIANQLKEGGDLYGKRGIIFNAFADGGTGLGARSASSICDDLKRLGVERIAYYHGQMALNQRREIQQQFEQDKLNIVVATKAFGMGIDYPKLGFVIHFYPPLSLEEYWQEAGRGGRGMDANTKEFCRCIVLHKSSDHNVLRGFPNIASFEKILGTYMTIAQHELYFNMAKVQKRGKLGKLLRQLQAHNYIRKTDNQQVGGILFECWKVINPQEIITYIKNYEKNQDQKQVKRLLSNLQILLDRQSNIIRIQQSRDLKYYELELNWLTEPDIAALEMIDDEQVGGVRYSRFRLLKDRLSIEGMENLSQKVKSYPEKGQAKLNYVFQNFLKAETGEKAKQIILKYLEQEEEEEKQEGTMFHATTSINPQSTHVEVNPPDDKIVESEVKRIIPIPSHFPIYQPPKEPKTRRGSKKGLKQVPDGTLCYFNHGGKKYEGRISNGQLIIGQKSYSHFSPASKDITGTEINGWKYWWLKLPGSNVWKLAADWREENTKPSRK